MDYKKMKFTHKKYGTMRALVDEHGEVFCVLEDLKEMFHISPYTILREAELCGTQPREFATVDACGHRKINFQVVDRHLLFHLADGTTTASQLRRRWVYDKVLAKAPYCYKKYTVPGPVFERKTKKIQQSTFNNQQKNGKVQNLRTA